MTLAPAPDIAAQTATLDADMQALSAALGGLTLVANPSTITSFGSRATFNAVDGGNGLALILAADHRRGDHGAQIFAGGQSFGQGRGVGLQGLQRAAFLGQIEQSRRVARGDAQRDRSWF